MIKKTAKPNIMTTAAMIPISSQSGEAGSEEACSVTESEVVGASAEGEFVVGTEVGDSAKVGVTGASVAGAVVGASVAGVSVGVVVGAVGSATHSPMLSMISAPIAGAYIHHTI